MATESSICEHIDNEGIEGDRCDKCNAFMGSDLVLGQNNIVQTNLFNYRRFIPSETHNYWFYSTDYTDSFFSIVDENFKEIVASEFSYDFDFTLNIELIEGKTYYLKITSIFGDYREFAVNLEKHSHEGSTQNCLGYKCDTCHEYYGEPGEHNPDSVEPTCQGYYCVDCHEYYGDKAEHSLDSYQTCLGYGCYYCGEYFGEGNKYNHSFWDGECEYCSMLEEDYVCEHDSEEQTCKGYFCYHCYSYYGDGSGEHNLEEYQTCKGYKCVDCGEYFGEVDPNSHNYADGVCELCGFSCNHFGGEQTCIGYKCEECGSFYGEADEDKHVWYYGMCEYHDLNYPSDLECSHIWNSYGDCKVCGVTCEHQLDPESGICDICNHQLSYSVTTNNVTVYYDSLSEVINNASEGSYVKLLMDTDEFNSNLNFNKAITFDLNGHEIVQPSSYSIEVSANVTFTDSTGGGYLSFSLRLYSPCIFEGGKYLFISIDFETLDTIEDYIARCSKAYSGSTDKLIEFNGDETYLEYPQFKIEHEKIDETCISYKCLNCGETFENKNDELHKFSNYQVSKEATCESNREETAVCEHCKTATDTKVVEDSKTDHIDNDKDNLCDYGCGTNTMVDTTPKESKSGCVASVLPSIFGVILLIGLLTISRIVIKKKVN